MDICATVDGFVSTPEGSPSHLLLQIPFTFRQVETVDVGIVDVRVKRISATPGNVEFATMSRTIVRPYAAARRNKILEDRPIKFQQEAGGGSNSLVFEFEIDAASLSSECSTDMKFIADIDIVFTSLSKIPFLCSFTINQKSGELNVQDISRKTKPGPALRNLLLLVLVALPLGFWNVFFNKDIYGQSVTLGHAAVSTGIGAALAFLGLSFFKVKGWFKTLRSVDSIRKFPEFHIDATVFQYMSTRWAGWVLQLLLLLSILFIGWYWSMPLPQVAEGEVIDSDGNIVRHHRAYFRDILGNEFNVVCSQGSDVVLADLILKPDIGIIISGILGPSVTQRRYLVKYNTRIDRIFADGFPEEQYSKTFDGEDLLRYARLKKDSKVGALILDRLCRSHDSSVGAQELRLSDLDGDRAKIREITIFERPVVEYASLYGIVFDQWNELSKKYRMKGPEFIWTKRKLLAEELSTKTQGLQGVVEAEDFKRIISKVADHISEIRPGFYDDESAVIAGIVFRGLFLSMGKKCAEDLSLTQLMELVDIVANGLSKLDHAKNTWRVPRSFWEPLLILEGIHKELLEDNVHKRIAMVDGGSERDWKLNYLVASIVTARLTQPDDAAIERYKFFCEEAKRWKRQTPTYTLLAKGAISFEPVELAEPPRNIGIVEDIEHALRLLYGGSGCGEETESRDRI
jgi:hypothetical protein